MEYPEVSSYIESTAVEIEVEVISSNSSNSSRSSGSGSRSTCTMEPTNCQLSLVDLGYKKKS